MTFDERTEWVPAFDPLWSGTLKSVAHARLHRRPFSWSVVDGFLPPGLDRDLLAEFPETKFRHASDGSGGCSFFFRDLVRDNDVVEASDLSANWKQFARFLVGAEYRAAIAELFGLSLDGTKVVAGFALYPPGAGLRPHTDRAMRVVTQTIYFNENWDSRWGGSLQLLRSSEPTDVDTEIDPTLGRSVLLARSAHSWHAVRGVRRGAEQVRKSVLLHFTMPG
jgi:Rps23 Pro-64 3,4-dihydroxylase Tpa1-like proline 4-hydroxylase